MPTKPKINVRLLRRIQKQIAKEPRQFEMDAYFWHSTSAIPNCGTACCIGGWAITLAGKFATPELARTRAMYCGSEEEAAEALGLTKPQANALFLDSGWPEPLH